MDNPLEKHAPRVNALRSHLYATNDERIILEIADYAAALQAERDMLARALQRVALDDTDAVRHNAGLIEAAKAQRERAAALQAELRLVRETCKINQRDYEAMQAELATIKEIDALNQWHYKDAERQLDECRRELHAAKRGTYQPVAYTALDPDGGDHPFIFAVEAQRIHFYDEDAYEHQMEMPDGFVICELRPAAPEQSILDDIEAVLELARAAQVIDLGGVKHRVAEWLKEQRKLTAAPEPPITQEALQAAGWHYILWNNIMPGYWKTLTSDNADRLDGPYLEVMFNERKDLPPETFSVYIVGANFKKMAKGVYTMRDLSDLHRLLTGALPGEGEQDE